MSLITSKQKLIPVSTAAKHIAYDRQDKAECARIGHAIRCKARLYANLVTVRRAGSVLITETSLNAFLSEMAQYAAIAEREGAKWTR